MFKRIIFISIMFLTVDCFGYFWEAFYKKAETKIDNKTDNKITTTIDKQTKDIKAGLNDIKAGVNENTVDLKALNDTMLNFKAEIDAKVVGLDQSMKAGRDAIYIKKNDANTLIYIAGGLFSFATGLTALLISIITLLIKSIFKRQKSLDKAQRDRERLQIKLRMQGTWLDNEIKAKEKYKGIVEANGKQ
jgi:hypothetical protein